MLKVDYQTISRQIVVPVASAAQIIQKGQIHGTVAKLPPSNNKQSQTGINQKKFVESQQSFRANILQMSNISSML